MKGQIQFTGLLRRLQGNTVKTLFDRFGVLRKVCVVLPRSARYARQGKPAARFPLHPFRAKSMMSDVEHIPEMSANQPYEKNPQLPLKNDINGPLQTSTDHQVLQCNFPEPAIGAQCSIFTD